MEEKSKPWRNSPQLLLSPIARANWPDGEQSAEDEPQHAAYPSVAAGWDNVRRFKASEQRCVKSHDGAIHAFRRILSFMQVVVGYCQAQTYCLVQSTFYLMDDNFRKSRKGGPAVRPRVGFA
jgi:hypothetical protein